MRPAHPPSLTKPGDRFVVMLQVGSVKGMPVFEPLGFGLPDQPSPEMLLRRGSRCTGFASEQEACDWLSKSATRWQEAGLTFHHKKQVMVLKVENFGP